MIHKVNLVDCIPKNLRLAAEHIVSILKKNKFEVYLVGGSVRDALLKRSIRDLDFATNALPIQVIKLFKRTIPVGIQFGTVQVLYNNISIQVTTYRQDGEYHDFRHPSTVAYSNDLQIDVSRRDFTINAMAYDLDKKEVIDYVGGLDDLHRRLIRTVGDPLQRLGEDGLRSVRACRFAATLDFKLESSLSMAIPQTYYAIENIARERLLAEWKKICFIDRQAQFWRLLFEAKLLKTFLQPFSFWKKQKQFEKFIKLIEITTATNISKNMVVKNEPIMMGIYLAYCMYTEYPGCQSRDHMDIRDKITTLGKLLKFSNRDINICIRLLYSPLFALTDFFSNQMERLEPCEEIEILLRKKISKFTLKNL